MDRGNLPWPYRQIFFAFKANVDSTYRLRRRSVKVDFFRNLNRFHDDSSRFDGLRKVGEPVLGLTDGCIERAGGTATMIWLNGSVEGQEPCHKTLSRLI